MTRTEFYKGWSIMIFDAGLPSASKRIMMAVGRGYTMDFPGVVVDENKAIQLAKNQIDRFEEKGDNDFENGELEKL